MFSGIGFVEMVVIAIVAILLFGQKLPEVARNMGRTYRELRKSVMELKSSIDFDEEPAPRSRYTKNNAVRVHQPSFDTSDEIDEPTAPKLAPPKPVDD
ncbi:MAG TPA: twin-arginine translocase TatA/TatE family subunit [Pirellulaceae bacterium]|nr:twin-arginine translocase TatA/TatE family subunit [Pirellulaceae bacterium]HMO92992.1 twin-arginine translocase TatA/TatE family subunit [Pirellulaceae bacterium]HMP67930.1 twin-arginine translocase TatA/TatE family subunit [Pirellulaceae bacterium]